MQGENVNASNRGDSSSLATEGSAATTGDEVIRLD
jgi:hypothetical protein